MAGPSQSAPQYDPAAEYQKGIAAYQAQNFKGAVTAFRHVIEVAAAHAPAQYLLGSSYLQMGDFKKAKRPLEMAVRYDAAMIEAHRDLGIVQAKLGDAAKATEQRDVLGARKTQCAATCPDAEQHHVPICLHPGGISLYRNRRASEPLQPGSIVNDHPRK